MKTFDDFYNKKLKQEARYAKKHKKSTKEFIEHNYKSMTEYKKFMEHLYVMKECHSFWHRDCENKNIECHRCSKFYSYADFDKMSVKQQRNI